MRTTIAQRIIAEQLALGREYLGMINGQLSYAKRSNLSRYLCSLSLTPEDVIVLTGARAGRHRNDGYQLLVFRKR